MRVDVSRRRWYRPTEAELLAEALCDPLLAPYLGQLRDFRGPGDAATVAFLATLAFHAVGPQTASLEGPADADAERDWSDFEPGFCVQCWAFEHQPCSPECSGAVIESACPLPELNESDENLLDMLEEEPLWLEPGASMDDVEDALADRVAALELALEKEEAREGSQSCRWCRELVFDDFDHDFCEPDEETEPMLILTPEGPEPELRFEDSVRCVCGRWHPFSLVAPPDSVAKGMVSATTVTCVCETVISLAYSWARRAIVGCSFRKGRFAAQLLN